MENCKIYKCEICGNEYTHKASLRVHLKKKHNIIIKNTECHFTICPLCNERIGKGHFSRHLISVHNIKKDSRDFYIYRNAYANNFLSKIEDKKISENLMSYFYDKYGNTPKNFKNFVSYYRAISRIREYNVDSDNKNFVQNVFEWKIAHPKLGNCKELCKLMFPNEPENAERYYNEFMLSNNPFVGHDGSLSPFSKDFVGYKNLDDKEKEVRIEECLQHDKIGRNTNQIEYWTKRGLTRLEAKKMVHQRQQTFSKERCVEKYGYEEGMKIWKERQERWQNTLNSKPYEEQLRILKAKADNSKITKPYSKLEHEFSSQLVSDEYKNVAVTPYAIPDICVGWKIIDFFGDYYHCNPKKYKPDFYNHCAKKTAQEIWNKDAERTARLEHEGYIVKIVWESDYKADKKKVINECREFLKAE